MENSLVHPQVVTFLATLARANCVVADGPLLGEWDVNEATGDPSREVVAFKWEDGEGLYEVRLTEAAVSQGEWKGNSFFCKDQDGVEVQISMYETTPIAPTCKQCGCEVVDGYCKDQTCIYSDWPQTVDRKDLSVFATDEVEEKYGVRKRIADPE